MASKDQIPMRRKMTQITNFANVSFVSIDPSFEAIVGSDPKVLWGVGDPEGNPMFHEACVYHPPTKSVFIHSNLLPSSYDESFKNDTSGKIVVLSQVTDNEDPSAVYVEQVTPTGLPFGNGGANFQNGLVFCAQGNKLNDPPSGVVFMPDPKSPEKTELLVSDFYNRSFNSPNDLVVNPEDETIWFTDPAYGFPQGFRPPPELPSQVYRFDPKKKFIRVVADGFRRPNGICFSPDTKIVYISDTGAITGEAGVPFDKTGPSTIYAYDVLKTKNGPFLTNRRVFAFADTGLPDGIKVDTRGNVYSGCGDGVHVWNSGGTLIGKILVKGGIANFAFGEKGAVYLCNEQTVWKAQLGDQTRGAALGL